LSLTKALLHRAVNWSLALRPERVVVMIVMRRRLATAGAAVVRRRVATMRSGRAAAATPTTAAGAVVRRILARARLSNTSTTCHRHLHEDLKKYFTIFGCNITEK
jgi:hypothetical protein